MSSTPSSGVGDFGMDSHQEALSIALTVGVERQRGKGGDMTRGDPCGDKQGHETKEQAKAHRNNLIRRGNSLLEVYKCPWCDKWHVGHRPKGKSWGRATKRRRGR